MDEAEKCDRIGMMARGKLLVEGRPEELKSGFPFKVLTISAEPLFAARLALGRLPEVRTAVMHGDSVHVVTDQVETLCSKLATVLAADGVQLSDAREVPAGLEDVFVHELSSRGLTTPGAAVRGGGEVAGVAPAAADGTTI
jgi:ABC-2 type transport system ATP-binding protein